MSNDSRRRQRCDDTHAPGPYLIEGVAVDGQQTRQQIDSRGLIDRRLPDVTSKKATERARQTPASRDASAQRQTEREVRGPPCPGRNRDELNPGTVVPWPFVSQSPGTAVSGDRHANEDELNSGTATPLDCCGANS
ncbi:hypothetical protein THAOC_09782 [Thalassiosira oceanica]|uniref:Uncharacterized protein n=1 Tax=Thalassiosira oceanica TaxID=159749 RepID=K0SRQ8_THAOC|nr:hypothetical protein THAOC_09782 [Thalassiosira oceanica]|eukprot:EJK69003.1 hypothetical protein THAOC_09782 [Thalassiosira oceanica]